MEEWVGVIVTENPKTIGNSTAARHGLIGTLSDPPPLFLQIDNITIEFFLQIAKNRKNLSREFVSQVADFDKSNVFR